MGGSVWRTGHARVEWRVGVSGSGFARLGTLRYDSPERSVRLPASAITSDLIAELLTARREQHPSRPPHHGSDHRAAPTCPACRTAPARTLDRAPPRSPRRTHALRPPGAPRLRPPGAPPPPPGGAYP